MNFICESTRPAGLSDQRDELPVQLILGQAVPGAGTQGLGGRFVPLVSQQSENAGARVKSANIFDRLDPSAGGKIQIHQGDVWPMFAEQVKRLIGGGGSTHQLHIRLGANQYAEAFPQQWIVIHRKDANLTWFHSPQSTRDSALRGTPKSGGERSPDFRGSGNDFYRDRMAKVA